MDEPAQIELIKQAGPVNSVWKGCLGWVVLSGKLFNYAITSIQVGYKQGVNVERVVINIV